MKKDYYKFLFLSVFFVFLSVLTSKLLNLEVLYFNSFEEIYSSEEIKNMIKNNRKWYIYSSILTPIFLFIKIFIITNVIQIGTLLFDISISYKRLLSIVLNGEFIFLTVPIIKLVWFYFFQNEYNFQDVLYFYPFSALNFLSYKDLDPWFIYPIQTFNLFELFYIIYLGYQVGKISNTNFDKGITLVLYTYVPFLVLWIAIVMFFTLNLL